MAKSKAFELAELVRKVSISDDGSVENTGDLKLSGAASKIVGPSEFKIDPAAHGDNTGKVIIAGDLEVNGTTTTINSTTLTIDDKNIILGSGATASANNGAGITVDGASATIIYTDSTTSWDFNKDIKTTGTVTANGGTSTNWNTAYGWGNHASAGYLTNSDLVTDTTPQLGGNLDVNSNQIISSSNGNIVITPNGSGKVVLDGLSYPTADGANNTVLKTDGAGNLSFASISAIGGGGIAQVQDDTSPTLGGTLDANGNTIDMGTNNITDTAVGQWNTAYGWGDHGSAGYLTSQTSHSDVVVDGDFSSNGIMTRTGAGSYAMLTDNSSNWNTAYSWGNHASGGYAPTAGPTFTDAVNINSTGYYLVQDNSESLIRSESQPIILQTYASSAWQDRLTINNNGNANFGASVDVGVNATVNGILYLGGQYPNIRMMGTANSTNQHMKIEISNTAGDMSILSYNSAWNSGTAICKFRRGGGVTVHSGYLEVQSGIRGSGGAQDTVVDIGRAKISGTYYAGSVSYSDMAVFTHEDYLNHSSHKTSGFVVVGGNGQSRCYFPTNTNFSIRSNSYLSETTEVEVSTAGMGLRYGLYVGSVGGTRVNNEIRAEGNITAYYSDERLKDFDGKIENAIDKIQKINGYYYSENEKAKEFGYKNQHKKQVGVSAQEIEKVLPEVVSLAPFDIAEGEVSKTGEDYKTVDYARIIPLLIEAIKEQQEQIKTLEEKLDGFTK